MELELLPAALANITRFFDYDDLQATQGDSIVKHLPRDFFDDYLRDYPEALSELPEPLRKTLTQDLQLKSAVLHKAQSLNTSLLGQDGKAIDAHSKIILPYESAEKKSLEQPRLILPNANSTVTSRPQPPIQAEHLKPTIATQAIQQQGDLLVPKTAAWQTLYDRWKALDWDTKQSLVRWEKLGSSHKANLAIRAHESIRVKEDLPPEEKRLFKERLSWGRDQNALEFRHREDLGVSDLSEFFKDVRLLAQRAGIERKILNPQDNQINILRAGLHFHISVENQDLTDLGKAFNQLELIRLIKFGVLDDLKGEGRFLYDPEAKRKGLVRIVAPNRLEFRDHNLPLQDELNFIVKVLRLGPVDGLKVLDHEIKGLMSDDVVATIEMYRSSYLADFSKYMTPEQKQRTRPLITFIRELRHVSSSGGLPQDFWHRAPAFFASKDVELQRGIATLLERQPVWPNEFWKHVPAMMANKTSKAPDAIASALDRQSVWPKEFWDRVPTLLTNKSSVVQIAIASTLQRQSSWPKEVWDQVPALMLSKDSVVQTAVSYALLRQSAWPKEIWDHVPTLIASKDPKVQTAILYALGNQSHWPKGIQDHVVALLKSKDPKVLLVIPSAFEKQTAWPKELWDRVSAFLASKNSNLSFGVASALIKQPVWPEEVWTHVHALRTSSDYETRSNIEYLLRQRQGLGHCIEQQVTQLLR